MQQILDAGNANVEVTKGWWDSYLKRHPKLILRHTEPISYARAMATNPVDILTYWKRLYMKMGSMISQLKSSTVMRQECL